MITRSFGEEVWRLTANQIAFSVGMIAGGFLIGYWGGFKNKFHTMAVACLLIGGSTFVLGIVPAFWMFLIFMGLIGVAMPYFNTPSAVLLQEKVEVNFLGRVFGVLVMISTSMMPLGMMVFGPLADLFPIEWILAGTGLLMFVQGIFQLGNKVLLKAGESITKGVTK